MTAAVAVWLILSGIWGSTWLFIKLGLEDLPPLSFAGIRFLIAFTVLAAVVAVRRLPLPRKRSDWGIIAITGFLSFTLNYGLLFWGEQLKGSSSVRVNLGASHPTVKLYDPTLGTSPVQTLANAIDYGDGPQDATSRPRLHDEGEMLLVDSRIPESVRAALAAKGHEIEVKVDDVLATNFARPSAIAIDGNGLRGGVEGTKIGIALGF